MTFPLYKSIVKLILVITSNNDSKNIEKRKYEKIKIIATYLYALRPTRPILVCPEMLNKQGS